MAMVCFSLVEVVMAGLIISSDFWDGEAGGKASCRKSARLVSFCLPVGMRGPEQATKPMARACPSVSWLLLL